MLTDLAWLGEMGLVACEVLAPGARGCTVPTLTQRGYDVALGRAQCPGVRRPLPGDMIKGKPLSSLVDANGNPAPGTAYGVTTLTAEQWEEMTGKYGHMAMFAKDSPVIFAAPSKKGDAQANEQANVKTGFEQVQVDGVNADKSLNTTPDKS